jgi:hypothetical protein
MRAPVTSKTVLAILAVTMAACRGTQPKPAAAPPAAAPVAVTADQQAARNREC